MVVRARVQSEGAAEDWSMNKRLPAQLFWFFFQILTCALIVGHCSVAEGAFSGSLSVTTMARAAPGAPSIPHSGLGGDRKTSPKAIGP